MNVYTIKKERKLVYLTHIDTQNVGTHKRKLNLETVTLCAPWMRQIGPVQQNSGELRVPTETYDD